jgi:CRISPR-associated endonuclease Cas1
MDVNEVTAKLTSEDVVDGAEALCRTFSRQAQDPSVAVVDGYGIRLRVERGHLEAEDGIGRNRRERRWPRAERTLRRVIVRGEGVLTTDALRHCRAIGASVVVLDDDGVTLASSAPGHDDGRLRRAQALATGTETGLAIVRELLRTKLVGQEQLARSVLGDHAAADTIESLAEAIADAADVGEARQLEAAAAASYFGAWPKIDVVRFVAKDTRRVPAHWRRFDGRRSALRLGNSNQRAERPLNAILNYCYRLAEIEARLAVVAVGLDPGLGFLHADYPGRDALALDLLEPIRPAVERYVLRLVGSHRFRKGDFTETPDGHVRVLTPLTHELAETMPSWAKAVAPHAEAIVHALAEMVPGRVVKRTPLTSAHRKAAHARVRPTRRRQASPRLPGVVCAGCGAPLERPGYTWCPACLPAAKQRAIAKAKAARRATRDVRQVLGLPDPSQTPEAKARKGSAIGRRDVEALAWEAAHPGVVVDAALFAPIGVALGGVTVGAIARVTGLSTSYSSQVRKGECVPHPRHWPALAELAGVPCPFENGAVAGALDLTWWREVVVPKLASVSTVAIGEATGLSKGQCSKLRRGLNVPHPRHWPALAELAGAPLLQAEPGPTRDIHAIPI